MDSDVMKLWFGSIPGVGLNTMQSLMDEFGTLEDIYCADRERLIRVKGLSEAKIENILSEDNRKKAERHYKWLKERKLQYYSYFEEKYPQRLRTLYKPPKHIYVKGGFPDLSRKTIGIVGARNCTYYGRDMARMFGYRLARAGMNVISGMAKGIDGWAHQGALESGGKTYAVLGSGVEVCYPPIHERLYESIGKNGGVLSELPPLMKAQKQFFPLRNRIISGLSDGLLVVEAKRESGSLITANAALEQGRDVFVIPGRIGDVLSEGCNRLICQGAIPVLSPNDILEYYKINTYNIEETTSELEQKILSELEIVPVHMNELAEKLDLEPTKLIKILFQMSDKKCIREVGRGYYVKQ